jgi:hypothetical protein
MKKVKLIEIAHGRSGDKGNASNVGIIARHPDVYPFLVDKLTTDVVKQHMKNICKGKVERFEMPTLVPSIFCCTKASAAAEPFP